MTTNSICQGQQASDIWPVAFKSDVEISFAHLAFKWRNLASQNAGVTVIIIGLSRKSQNVKRLFGDDLVRECSAIGPYLVPDRLDVVAKADTPIGEKATMLFGNMPRDGGYLFLSSDEAEMLRQDYEIGHIVRRFVGSEELIHGKQRHCLWVSDGDVERAKKNKFIAERFKLVAENRLESPAQSTRDFAVRPHRFVQIGGVAKSTQILVPGVSSENRDYLPCDYQDERAIASNKLFAL